MDLKPAERNPAELRRTALILVAIMVLGATFILHAYFDHEKTPDSDRPPLTAKITRNFAAKNQHDKLVALYGLKGKIWFVVPFCVSQLDENKHALAMMRELEKHYRERDDVWFVFISIEGADQGVEPGQLAEAARKLGMTGDRCWFLTTGNTGRQRGYIKNQLRLGFVSDRKEGDPSGKWKFPSQIALVDRRMHVRQRYDFKEARDFELKAERELVKHPELKDEKSFDVVLHAVEKLKKTLHANTRFVLEEIKTGSKE